MQTGVEILIILLLLLANGVFAMAEISVVSARKGKLRQLADAGSTRARAALELAESPNRFLSTVQIGITLVGIIAGAFGGAHLSDRLASVMVDVPVIGAYAKSIAFFLVVASITYCSLVIGELVPKRIGLNNPEGIAMTLAGFMHRLSAVVSPAVTFLGFSTDALLRIFGVKPKQENAVSEEEVKVLMQEGMRAGAFHHVESQMVSSVLELDLLHVRDLMTPKPKMIWINADEPHDAVWHKIVVSGHSYFPVYRKNRDNVVGIVSIKAIYANLAAGVGVAIKDVMVTPLVVPETQNTLQLLETFKTSGKHIALVTNEFGSITGIVSINDIMEAIVGDLSTQEERAKPEVRQRDDDTWLIDAMVELEKVERALPGFKFPHTGSSDYQTLAGFVVKQFGRVPKEGETFEQDGYVFEVLDMDRHRVDKVLVMKGKGNLLKG